jgi:micrococcal nuclease
MTRSKPGSKPSSKPGSKPSSKPGGRKRTRSARTASGPSRLVTILAVVVVAVAAYVYFTRYPDQAGALLREVLQADATPAATSPTRRPAATAAPAGQPEGYPERPSGLRSGQVTDVVDGDTVDVDLGGEEVRLRLIGINTPESVDPRRPVECYGREASDKAKELLSGQTVYLEPDPSQDERDRYGRLLRFVWLEDGRMFNLEMVAQGYAYEYTYESKYKYQAEFRAAQAGAEANELGLWSSETCGGEPGRPAEP